MNMEFRTLANSIKKFLVEQTISRLDVESVQKILQYGIGKLKDIASGTTNQLDDWAIGEIENYLQDTAKVEQIRAFIVAKLGKLCEAAPNTGEYETLQGSLAVCHDGCCGTPCGNKLIANLLEGIIDPIIEHFKETE